MKQKYTQMWNTISFSSKIRERIEKNQGMQEHFINQNLKCCANFNSLTIIKSRNTNIKYIIYNNTRLHEENNFKEHPSEQCN